MLKKLSDQKLNKVIGGKNIWWYVGYGYASATESARRNPSINMNHFLFTQPK